MLKADLVRRYVSSRRRAFYEFKGELNKKMNIYTELKKAWDNAVLSADEKRAATSELDKLKEEINSGTQSALPQKPVLDVPPKYELMEKDRTDDAQLAAKAADSLKSYEQSFYSGIDKETEAMREKLNADKTAAQSSREQTLKEVDTGYDKAKQNTENDVLKRGLARSSIAVNNVSQVEQNRAEAHNAVQTKFAETIAALDSELSGLEVKRQQAVNDFNISLAVKLQDKIDELKKTRDDANKEALKYNNSIAEKEANDKIDKAKTESDLYTEALTQRQKEDAILSSDKATAAVYNSNYNKMDSLLSQMNRSDAAKLLKEDSFFRDNLTDYQYYSLYEKYAR